MKMKHLTPLLALLLSQALFAQVKIGDNPETIDPASLLELQSTDQVLVITRVTTPQMEAITPSNGALVYNTEASCLFYYDGQRWINLCEALGLSFTNDPIVNRDSTIIITEFEDRINLEVGRIRGGDDTGEFNNIIDFSVTSQDIQNNSINIDKLADASVGTAELFDNAVTAAKLNANVAGTGITQNAAGALEVDVSNITGNGNIISEDLTVGGSVDPLFGDVTLEIAAGAVGNSEIAGDAITSDKIADQAVAAEDIQDGAVTAEKIDPSVAGIGLVQNATTGALDVNVIEFEGDGTLSSPNGTITVEGNPANALFDDVQVEVDVASLTGDGNISSPNNTITLSGNPANSLLEDVGLDVDVTALTGDGSITSPDNSVTITGGANALLEDVTLAVDPTSITGDGTISSPNNTITLTGNPANSILEDVGLDVDVTALTGDGSITSPDNSVTIIGGTNALLEDVTLAVDPTSITGDGTISSPNNTITLTGNPANSILEDVGLDVDVTALTGDGSITSPDNSVTITGGANALLEDVTLAVDPTSITGAGTISSPNNTITLSGNPANSLLEDVGLDVDVTALTGDGSITSPDNSVIITGGINSLLEDVTLSVDGSETILDATNSTVVITGDGTTTNPYVITVDGLEGSIFFSDGAGGLDQNNAQLFWDATTNRLGIGTNNPQNKLHVAGQTRSEGFASSGGTANEPAYSFSTGDDSNTGMFRVAADQLAFSTGGTEALRMDATQNVGIAQTAPQARLHVGGDIRADGSFISNDTTIQIPDYVFQSYFKGHSDLKPNYEMSSLEDIRDFIKKHHHLPGVTSAIEVEKQGGIILNKAMTQNLEKIEELFLYTIEQEDKIEALQKENNDLSKELETLKERMARMESLLIQKKED